MGKIGQWRGGGGVARGPSVPIGRSRPLSAIWRQAKIPVIARPRKEPPLFVRLPFAIDNRPWLHACGRLHPERVKNDTTGITHWEVPVAWFGLLIRRCIERYGRVYVIQPLDRNEICARSCWEAKRDLCECSCYGTNHGGGQPDGHWKEITEAFALQSSRGELACQLLSALPGRGSSP